MTLTAVPVTRQVAATNLSAQIPRCLLIVAIAIDTGDTKGAALLQAGSESPAAIVEFTGDAAWYWSDTDALATANMKRIPADVPERVQCTPGRTQNFYMKTATTANIMASIVQ